MVQQGVDQAFQAVFDADVEAARRVIDGDDRIDDEEVQVEKAAIDLLALHQPAAGDLRLITTAIKVNSELERVADCAVNVAQRVLPLARAGDYDPPSDLRLMCRLVSEMLRDSTRAFGLNNIDLARQVIHGDDAVDALYHQVVHDMVSRMERDGQRAAVELANVMIAKNVERIADHCTNIAEDVIYVHTGQIIRHLHAV